MFNFFKKQQPEEPKRLTGPELIAKVDELDKKGVSKRDIVIACGYVKGLKYADFDGFYEQMLIDKFGVNSKNYPIGKGGRKLSYRAIVAGTGNLIIGKAYTSQMNLEPGDEFRIKLTKSGILLIPLGRSVDHIDTSEIKN